MRGASVHLAPSGARGILIGQVVFASTLITKPRRVPSGAQVTPLGDFSTRVTWEMAPSASM